MVSSFPPCRPRPLELTAADELLALENIDIIRNNGFELAVDEEAPRKGDIIENDVYGSWLTDDEIED